MLLLDDLLLSPGSAVMKIFEELARKAQEEFLDDGAVKNELRQIYALLESGSMSESDFTTQEQALLQRLEQIARAKLALAPAAPDTELLSPAPSPAATLDFAGFDVPHTELPTLELPPIDLPPVEFPAITTPEVVTPRPQPVLLAREPAAAQPQLPAAELPAAQLQPLAPEPPPPAPPAPPPVKQLAPTQVVECALRGLSMLKMRVSTVTAVMKIAGGWQVTAELIESRAVPDTSDLLGIYEMQLDEGGNILGYVRTRMRRRCDLSDRR